MVLLFQENQIRLTLIAQQQLTSQRSTLQKQILQWQHVVATHADYRDGYFELAVLEYQLGNIDKARMYNQQALTLDPNFKSGEELERKLR